MFQSGFDRIGERMAFETIGEMPPIYLLAYVIFGTFFALGLYHLVANEKFEQRRERAFAWVCIAFLWGGSGLMVYLSSGA